MTSLTLSLARIDALAALMTAPRRTMEVVFNCPMTTTTVPATLAVPEPAAPRASAETVSLEMALTLTAPPAVMRAVSPTSVSVVPLKYVTKPTGATPAVPPTVAVRAALISSASLSLKTDTLPLAEAAPYRWALAELRKTCTLAPTPTAVDPVTDKVTAN